MIILRPFFYIGYTVLTVIGYTMCTVFTILDGIMEHLMEVFIVGLLGFLAFIVFYDPPELQPATETDFALLKDTNQTCTLPAMDAKIDELKKNGKPVLQRDVTRVIKACVDSAQSDKSAGDQKAMMQKALGK